MRPNLGCDNVSRSGHLPSLFHAPYWFGSESDGDNDPAEQFPRPAPTEREDLPFKVELWDDAFEMVDQVLAVTADGSIGFGAYHAAIKEFPGRNITLRHKNRVVARSYARGH